jgi:hypothetical protein
VFDLPSRAQQFDDALDAAEQVSSQTRGHSGRYTVGDANDSAEQRADAAADRGVAILRAERSRFPAGSSTASGPGTRIQRSANGSTIGLGGGPLDDSLGSELDGAMGRGRRFEPRVQRSVRRAIGHDVGDVSVHTDARADRLARSMQASAFTVDRNVFFAKGQYRPDTDDGMHTILHESAHVAEGAGRVQRRTIRRRISATTEQLDGAFNTGLLGIGKSMGSGDIPKIRKALKQYQMTKPGTPGELEELKNLLTLGDEWMRKHPKAKDSKDRARMEQIDSIRTQAGIEFAKLSAASIYMNAGAQAGAARQQQNAVPGPDALTALKHGKAFVDPKLYENRASAVDGQGGYAGPVDENGYPVHLGARATFARDRLVGRGELAAADPETEAALTAAIGSLTPAEFAAIHTYTDEDYGYINPNVGGWGKGPMNAAVDMKMPNEKGALLGGKAGQMMSYSKDDHDPATKQGKKNYDSYTDAATAKKNRDTYQEAGLHAGFIGEAFRKLPLWTGTTYKGMTMSVDYLGLTSKSSYTANDFWSTSEALSVSLGFLPISAGNKAPTMAAICVINVTDGRDVSRISNSPEELEILLAPGSTLSIGQKWCLEWGQDNDEIYRLFGAHVVDDPSMYQVQQWWWIELNQQAPPKRF